MSEYSTNWTKDELIAYMLIYAAKANFVETEEEREIILSRVTRERFDKIHNEIDNDNDYKSVQKIYFALEKHNFSHKDTAAIISEIKALFWSDGTFDRLENNLLMGLKRMLRK